MSDILCANYLLLGCSSEGSAKRVESVPVRTQSQLLHAILGAKLETKRGDDVDIDVVDDDDDDDDIAALH